MAEHVVKPRTYYLVFAALLVLTLLTVGASYLELGPLHTGVASADRGEQGPSGGAVLHARVVQPAVIWW